MAADKTLLVTTCRPLKPCSNIQQHYFTRHKSYFSINVTKSQHDDSHLSVYFRLLQLIQCGRSPHNEAMVRYIKAVYMLSFQRIHSHGPCAVVMVASNNTGTHYSTELRMQTKYLSQGHNMLLIWPGFELQTFGLRE